MYFIHTTCPWKQSTIYWIRFISWSFDASWWKCTQSSLPSVTSIATYSRVKERTWNIAQSKVPCLSVNVFVFEPVFIYCIILCSRKRDMKDCTEHSTLFICRVKSQNQSAIAPITVATDWNRRNILPQNINPAPFPRQTTTSWPSLVAKLVQTNPILLINPLKVKAWNTKVWRDISYCISDIL